MSSGAFFGRVEILRVRAAQVQSATVWGLVALVPVMALLMFVRDVVPPSWREAVTEGTMAVGLMIYAAFASWAVRPDRKFGILEASSRGLVVDGTLLVARDEIVRAYLRPPVEPVSESGITAPAWPPTVEIVTASQSLHLAPDSEADRHAILTAFGAPIATKPWSDTASHPRTSRKAWIALALVTIALLGLQAMVMLGTRQGALTTPSTRDEEARTNLRKIFDSSVAYYECEHADASGTILPSQFPAAVPLSARPCCAQRDGVCAGAWLAPTWKTLDFAPEGPTRYRYEYVSSGTGKTATFTARAVGDPRCNGQDEMWEVTGNAKDDGNVTPAQPHRVK